MPQYPLRYSFVVNYVIDSTFETGIAQAFTFKNEELHLLSLEDEKSGKVRWVPARSCTCRKILSIFAIKEIIDRDQVKLEDLEIIQDFEWKYLEALSEKGEL